MKIDHLSMTGYYAGQRYCGDSEGTSCHEPYAVKVEDMPAWVDAHINCAECRKICKESITEYLETEYGQTEDTTK